MTLLAKFHLALQAHPTATLGRMVELGLLTHREVFLLIRHLHPQVPLQPFHQWTSP